MAKHEKVLTLSDPRALRALAHPARQYLLRELLSGRVLTATQAAELVGLGPSAVSHHLRVLEKWGLAKRARPTSDGRERPWQGTVSSISFTSSSSPGSAAAAQSLTSEALSQLGQQVAKFMARPYEDSWRPIYRALSQTETWLTKDETEALAASIDDLIATFERTRTIRRHPKSSRRTAISWSVIPLEPPPGSNA
jgi:DNA-binding transcriptional ArsR family regulator